MKSKHLFIVAMLITLLFTFSKISAQNWIRGGNGGAGFPFLGSDAFTNQAIQFGTFNITRMFIQNNIGPTAGFIGIGSGFTAPLFQLDVQDNINLNTGNALSRGYWIDGFVVLQVPGTENTFVGKGTGANANITPPTPFLQQNTFVGFQAGGLNVDGDRNTFVGRAAGYANINGRFNTFLGCDAGLNMVSGNENTFVGEHSGFRQVSGDNNTYVGGHSGQGTLNSTGSDNTFTGAFCGPAVNNGNENTFAGMRAGNNCSTGDQNCFYGKFSGLLTNGGSRNVFMGYLADRFNRGGNDNTFVGNLAGVPTGIPFQNLNNANGFGSGATATASNTMILGDNSVNVGIGLSGNLVSPSNKLEINANAANLSGLTFRQLPGTSASLTAINPGPGVLALGTNGEVIYVPAGTANALVGAHNGTSLSTITPNFVAWGQNVGQAGNPGQLLNNREIPQNQFNIQFIDGAVPTPGLNRISFGQLIPVAQSTKFYVFNNIERVGATFEMDATLVPQPVSLSETSVASKIIGLNDAAVTGIAVLGNSNNLISKANIGVAGNALNGVAENIGVMGSVPLNSISSGTAFNYGGYFSATGFGLQNFGIYAGAANGSAANYAGFFNGDIFVSGPISGTGYVLATSDQIFKTNIDSISNAIDIINQLLPKTYFMDTANVYGMRFASTRQYGFVAQDVETILPELVSETTKPAIYDSTNQVMNPAITYKSLNYDAFIAILMKGIQEQQRQIDSLQSQINSCCNSNERTQNPNNNQTDVTLTNAESVVLNQNVPNPFAEQTTITYNLPESVQKAQLLFYDATGKLIKSVDLTARGNGQINVFANDLSNGIYSYALVVDGQIADTKRMVKTN